MKYPKLRELKEAIKALIKGPYTSKYPYEPHKPFERFRGRPYFHDEYCIGCAACAQVCPAKAIEVEDKKDKRVLTVHWDICIFCGQCQANCPSEKGIVLSREFEFATTGKRQELKNSVEKEFVLCEACGEQVVPHDQYVWVAKRLGSSVFSNSSLLLHYLKLVGLTFSAEGGEKFSSKKESAEFSRADRVKILCPRCRREAVIKS